METGIKEKQGLTSGKVYYLVLSFLKIPDFFTSHCRSETCFLLNSSHTVLWLNMLLGNNNNALCSYFLGRAVLRPCDVLWWDDILHRHHIFYVNYRYDFQNFVRWSQKFLTKLEVNLKLPIQYFKKLVEEKHWKRKNEDGLQLVGDFCTENMKVIFGLNINCI